jgi:hypothetical protein
LKQGAPLGNKNAAKAKVWEGALRAALAQYENKDAKIKPGEALRKVAEMVVTQALVGNKDAWKEIGDRLDGKAVQPIQGDIDVDLTVEIVKFAGKAP